MIAGNILMRSLLLHRTIPIVDTTYSNTIMASCSVVKESKSTEIVRAHRNALNHGRDGSCNAAIASVIATSKSTQIVTSVCATLFRIFIEISKYSIRIHHQIRIILNIEMLSCLQYRHSRRIEEIPRSIPFARR